MPDSPCYDVDLFDGLDDADTTELQATFACLNSQAHLAPLAPTAESLDRATSEGPAVGVALVKGSRAALQRADIRITSLLDTLATSLDDPDEPVALGVDLLLELAHGQPASALRAPSADLRDPEALASAPLTRLAPVLLQAADTLGRRPALRRRLGDLLGDPELVRWVHTVEAFLTTDHPHLPPLTEPLLRDIGDALLAVAPNADDPRPNRLRRGVEILLAGEQPLLGQLARPTHDLLSDQGVREGFEDAIVRWHDRGHLGAVAAELAWLASVTPQGRPRSRGADSGLTAMVRMLHAGNRPIRCTVDLGLTDLSIDLGNLSLVLLDVLADQPADTVFSATDLLGGALGSPITDTLLDLFASTGVCPALTPQFLSDLEVVSLLDEDQADDLVVVFLDLLRLLRDGSTDRLPEIADIASTLVDTNTLVPLEDLVRDLGPQPLLAHVVGLAPMLARPARWGIRHPRSLPAELLDVIDILDTLVAPRTDGPGLGFEPWVPLVEEVLLQDNTWEALDAAGRVWSDPRTTWSTLPPRLPGLLALDPELRTVDVASTLVLDDAVASPLLSAIRQGSLVAQLSAARPTGSDPRVPVAFLSELATDGTLDDTLDLVRILLDLLEDGAAP